MTSIGTNDEPTFTDGHWAVRGGLAGIDVQHVQEIRMYRGADGTAFLALYDATGRAIWHSADMLDVHWSLDIWTNPAIEGEE